MRWFNDLTIVWKLVVGFAVMVVVSATVGAFGISSIRQLDRAATEMYEHDTVPLVHLSRAVDNFQQLRIKLIRCDRIDHVRPFIELSSLFDKKFEDGTALRIEGHELLPD